MTFKKYKIQFLILLFFWLSGFLYYIFTIPDASIYHSLLLSWCIREPQNFGDFPHLYSLVWPILLEVIVFGFFMVELMQKYNPVITSKILAGTKKNHTVIIGYGHLSARIINYCIKNKKAYCVIEDDEEKVEDLINIEAPVVIGDPAEASNLHFASIDHAKEVFISVNNSRLAIICTEKIREINKKCNIYVRCFEDHIQEYLQQPPFNAYTFSTSKWAMEIIHKWIKETSGNAVVIGRDYLTHRIAYDISQQPKRHVFLFDDENDGIEFPTNDRLHLINEFTCYLSDLTPHVNLNQVSQVFICWKRDSEFDEAIYLTSKLSQRYPNIKLYIRLYDEEILGLVKDFKVKTFSSSENAFRRLQREVALNSAIKPKKRELTPIQSNFDLK